MTTAVSKRKFTLIFLVAYVAVYLLTRLVNLTLLPAHFDELVQLSRLDELLRDGQIFVGLSNDFKWLQLWIMAALSWLPAPPLWSSRVSSVLSGLAGGIGCYLLAMELYQKRAIAVLSALLYLLVPSMVLYDRLTLPDGLLTSLGIWIMLFSVWTVRKEHLGWGAATGVSICAASLTKLSGLGYLTIPLAAWLLFKRDGNYKAKTLQLALATYIPAVLAVLLLWVFVDSQNAAIYTSKLPDEDLVISQLRWFTNSQTALSWATSLVTLPLAMLGLSGAAMAVVRRDRAGIYLLVLPVVMSVPYVLVAKVWYPRYLLPMVPSILILGAWTLYRGSQYLSRFRWGLPLLISGGIICLLPALLTDFWLLFNPPFAALHPEERRQYIEGWPTTYGLDEAAAFVAEQAHRQPALYLALNDHSTLVHEGLKYYSELPANVVIVEYDPFSGHALQDLNDWALQRPTYLILNSAHEKGLNELQSNPELFIQGRSLRSFPKPGGWATIDVVQWLSIPATAEWWAVKSGVDRPIIASGYPPAADVSGAAQFVPLTPESLTEVDFVLLDAKTLATDGSKISGAAANSTVWSGHSQPGWALTLNVPGIWSLMRVQENAPPQVSLSETVGNLIMLNGFDLPNKNYYGGESVQVFLHWQALQDVPRDYVVFAQLIGVDGQLYAQQDAVPFLPTGSWKAGQSIAAAIEIPLTADIPPGSYQLIVGLYDPATGQRLPAQRDNGQAWADSAIVLDDVSISP